MNLDFYIEQISAYIDGEMTPAEKVAFEEILREQPLLQKKVSEHQEMKELALMTKKLQPNPNFTQDLMEKIQGEKPGKFRFRRIASIAAALFLFTYISFQFSNPSPLGSSSNSASLNVLNNFIPAFTEADISNADVFNFAVNRHLPLCNTGKCLEIIETPNGKGMVKVTDYPKTPYQCLDEFKTNLALNQEKSQLLDNVLTKYRNELNESRLYEMNNAVAVSSDLWTIKQDLMQDLLEVLDLLDNSSFDGYVSNKRNTYPSNARFATWSPNQNQKRYVIIHLDPNNQKPINVNMAKCQPAKGNTTSFAITSSFSAKNRDTVVNWHLRSRYGKQPLAILDSGILCLDRKQLRQNQRVAKWSDIEKSRRAIYAEMEMLKLLVHQQARSGATQTLHQSSRNGKPIVVQVSKSSPNAVSSRVVVKGENNIRIITNTTINGQTNLVRVTPSNAYNQPFQQMQREVEFMDAIFHQQNGQTDYASQRLQLENEILHREMLRLKKDLDSLKKQVGEPNNSEKETKEESNIPATTRPGAKLVNDN